MAIVQYIVLNWDAVASRIALLFAMVLTCPEWNRGAIIAQACHASCAAIVKYLERKDTRDYTAAGNLESMTKVVLKVNASACGIPDGVNIGIER